MPILDAGTLTPIDARGVITLTNASFDLDRQMSLSNGESIAMDVDKNALVKVTLIGYFKPTET